MSTEITFVDEQAAKSYDCGICLEKLRNPVAVCDDHMFCQACISGLVQRQGPIFRCPNCRKVCNASYVRRNRFIGRRMSELLTKCPNHKITAQKALYLQSQNTLHSTSNIKKSKYQRHSLDRSRSRSRSRSRERHDKTNDNIKSKPMLCQWTGAWSELHSHIGECPLQIKYCKYCNQLMMNKDKATHYLLCCNYPVQCEFCLCTVRRNTLSSHINNICDKKIVECSFCNAPMERMKMQNHQFNECPEFVINCPYLRHGCLVNVERRNLNQHMINGTAKHLELVDLSYSKLEKRVECLEGKMEGVYQQNIM